MAYNSNIFNTTLMSKVRSNHFNLSHDHKLSFNMGELIPAFVADVLPGDVWSIKPEAMLRLAPLVSPVMHKVNITQHFFFVPNRILWSSWEDFITNNLDVAVPVVAAGDQWQVGSMADYLGMPIGMTDPNIQVSAFPIAAYLKIWDEYYRDQNLQAERFVPLVSGAQGLPYVARMNSDPEKRAWMHDYFTSALPFSQKGDDVTIPVVDSQTVPVTTGTPGEVQLLSSADGSIISGSSDLTQADGSIQAGTNLDAYIDPQGTLVVDINNQAATINSLRRAFRLQEWLEKNARGGTRYNESIMAHFGVRTSDARLQRPEYLGGMKQNMIISEVLSTAETESGGNTIPVGMMAGHGISVGSGNQFKYRAEEHGWIIGILNCQPITAYQQGIHRMFSRTDRLDYAWPTFANIGEQEIKNKELYALGTEEEGEGIFGYIPRYSEYKYMCSRVSGEFRTTLAFWHMARIFSQQPNLNASFIEADPTNRIYAVPDEDVHKIYAHVYYKVGVVRKLPKYGIPTI